MANDGNDDDLDYANESPEDKQVREEKEAKLAAIARAKELDDLRIVMSTMAGRRAMWRLLGELGMYATPFVRGETDTTNFNLGAQNKALWLFGELLAAAPDRVADMEKENRK